jgi:hypothetical protein
MARGRLPPLPDGLDLPVLAVVTTNLVPVVGVLALGWSAAAVLGVYVVEVFAAGCWSLAVVPFAAKRPNNGLDERSRLLAPLQAKRGATRLPGPLPPVYLRNLPTLAAGCLLVPLELVAAFVVYALTRPTVTPAVAGTILAGGLAVFVATGVETWAEFFRDGGYRDHSPRSVLLGPFRHLLAVGLLLLVFVPLDASAPGDGAVVGPRTLLVGLMLGKIAHDLWALRVRRDDDRRGLFARLYGSRRTEPDPAPVPVPDGEPAHRVVPPRRAAAGDALLRGCWYGFVARGVFVLPVLALAALSRSAAIAAVGLALGGALAALRALTRYLRYGTVEYRCWDGVVVVHDRLLDAPQARVDRAAVTGATVSTGRVERLLGTESLSLSTLTDDDPAVRLFVPDPEELDTTDDPVNRPLEVVHVPDAAPVAAALGVGWRLERSPD